MHSHSLDWLLDLFKISQRTRKTSSVTLGIIIRIRLCADPELQNEVIEIGSQCSSILVIYRWFLWIRLLFKVKVPLPNEEPKSTNFSKQMLRKWSSSFKWFESAFKFISKAKIIFSILGCRGNAGNDVAWLIDGSASLGQANFQNTLDFAAEVSHTFELQILNPAFYTFHCIFYFHFCVILYEEKRVFNGTMPCGTVQSVEGQVFLKANEPSTSIPNFYTYVQSHD